MRPGSASQPIENALSDVLLDLEDDDYIPNACATLWLPSEIFELDVMPNAAAPVKHIKGGANLPLSPDK